jgi:hypothetical protein
VSEALTLADSKAFIAVEREIQKDIESGTRLITNLLIVNEKGWWRIEYKSFKDYCNRRWNLGESQIYRLMFAAKVIPSLPEPKPSTEKQVRALRSLPEGERGEAYQEAVDESNGEVPTANVVKEVVDRRNQKTQNQKVAPGRKTEGDNNLGLTKAQISSDRMLKGSLEVIEKVAGPNFVKAIKQGTVSISKKEATEMGKLRTSEIKEISELIAGKAWKYKQARKFLSKMPDTNTRVIALINFCIAAGGKYEADINGYKITVTALGKKR